MNSSTHTRWWGKGGRPSRLASPRLRRQEPPHGRGSVSCALGRRTGAGFFPLDALPVVGWSFRPSRDRVATAWLALSHDVALDPGSCFLPRALLERLKTVCPLSVRCVLCVEKVYLTLPLLTLSDISSAAPRGAPRLHPPRPLEALRVGSARGRRRPRRPPIGTSGGMHLSQSIQQRGPSSGCSAAPDTPPPDRPAGRRLLPLDHTSLPPPREGRGVCWARKRSFAMRMRRSLTLRFSRSNVKAASISLSSPGGVMGGREGSASK